MERSWAKARSAALGIALASVLVVVPLYAFKIYTKNGYSDFDVYYRAATQALHGEWSHIYDFNPAGDTPFRYGPPTLLLWGPLALLPFGAARLSWYFLQVIFTAGGFYFLSRAIRRCVDGTSTLQRLGAEAITAITWLYVLRFCLDNFTIGQATSVMFLGLCAALSFYLAEEPGPAGAFLLIPTITKIGTALNYLFLPLRAWRSAFIALLVSALVILAWCHSWSVNTQLWLDWVRVVAHDSTYFDASHYGSQSIKSALLRTERAGWISMETMTLAYLGCVLAICGGILWVWNQRVFETPRSKALLYAVGVLAYLYLMPETFKYSQPFLAVPVGVLLTCRLERLEKAALLFGILTLSLAGLDIYGSAVFFALQKASVPLIASLFLGFACTRQLMRESRPKALRVSSPVELRAQ